MNVKFFLPIRTGTLERERNRIAAKRGYHLRSVRDLDEQIAALQEARNEHYAAAAAYVDAELALDASDVAVKLDDLEFNPEELAIDFQQAAE